MNILFVVARQNSGNGGKKTRGSFKMDVAKSPKGPLSKIQKNLAEQKKLRTLAYSFNDPCRPFSEK